MPKYIYKARDGAGKPVKGAMEAATRSDLIEKLHKMGYMTTSVSEAVSGIPIESIFDKLKWINADDMLIFYLQLSNMISSGLPILMSLSTLSKQTENKNLREAIGNISRQVEAGNNLSQAFAGHSNIFTKLFINMVKAGEASGQMDAVLIRYVNFFEQQENLKRKIKGALFYPMILLCSGIMVTLFIVTFVIPQFSQIYLKAGIQLPVPTLIVYKTGILIKHYWYILIALILAVLIGIRNYFKTERGAFILDRTILKMPIIGPLYRKVTIARFSRTLATLLGSGVNILESLDITKEVVGNRVVALAISNVQKSVEKGERMSEPLKVGGEFPLDAVQMISVGEETGSLVEMLNKIADFYDITVGYAVKKLTTIIEPLFLVVMGAVVGLIMASMLIPMFDMIKTLRH